MTVNTTPASTPNNGTVVINTDGSYTYTPDMGYVGPDEFTYVVCDDGTPSLCDTAVVYIDIIDITIGGNHPPVAINDGNVTLEGTPVFGTAFNNDYDIDGDNLIYGTTPLCGPMNGTITLSSNGAYIYTPEAGFTGMDTICYRICDDGTPSMCDTAQILITVLPDYGDTINYPPFAGDDAYFTNMNTPVSGNVMINDHDPDSNNIVLNIDLVVPATNGVVVIAPNGNYSYLPDSGFCGTDQFVYEICDDGMPSECATATVYITVSCINSDLTTDTVYVNIPVSTSDLLCVNLNELPGTPITLTDLSL